MTIDITVFVHENEILGAMEYIPRDVDLEVIQGCVEEHPKTWTVVKHCLKDCEEPIEWLLYIGAKTSDRLPFRPEVCRRLFPVLAKMMAGKPVYTGLMYGVPSSLDIVNGEVVPTTRYHVIRV